MSMPSSSDEVATIAGSRPALSASSMRTRCSRAIEPWCARARSSPASSLRAPARRSARRRLLTKTIVERWARTSSSRRGWMAGQMRAPGRRGRPALGRPRSGASARRAPRPAGDMSSTGHLDLEVEGLAARPRRRWSRAAASRCATPSPPPRKRATSSSGRCVAERPMRWSGRGARSSSRSRDSARCAPRLVPTRAWISSTITVSTEASIARACEVRSRNSDSGVVMRMSGGWRAIRARSSPGVSPVRMPTVRRGGRLAAALGGAGDAGEGRAQVALDVDGQRLRAARRRRRGSAAARAGAGANISRSIGGQERGQGLARAGGREDQRGSAGRDRRPAEGLGAGRRRRTSRRTTRRRRARRERGRSAIAAILESRAKGLSDPYETLRRARSDRGSACRPFRSCSPSLAPWRRRAAPAAGDRDPASPPPNPSWASTRRGPQARRLDAGAARTSGRSTAASDRVRVEDVARPPRAGRSWWSRSPRRRTWRGSRRSGARTCAWPIRAASPTTRPSGSCAERQDDRGHEPRRSTRPRWAARSDRAWRLAYRLATSDDPRPARSSTGRVILMMPSHNPDGTRAS